MHVMFEEVARLYGLRADLHIIAKFIRRRQSASKPGDLTMNRPKKLILGAAFLVLALAPIAASAVNAAAADRAQLAMMDDDKMSAKPDQSGSKNMNMGPSGGQPQNMGGGRMNDDRMKKPGQMQDCQDSGCQQNSGMMQMMQMMEKMMRGQTGSSSGASAASGSTDVTERIEGRIAFLKAELQITDKQLADWNNLADALRSSRRHLLEARRLLATDDKMAGTERLEHYERHVSERLEAIKSARSAFNQLYASSSESQKQTADAILLPLIAAF